MIKMIKMIKNLKIWLSNKSNLRNLTFIVWVPLMLAYFALAVDAPRSIYFHIVGGLIVINVIINLLLAAQKNKNKSTSFDRNIKE